MAEVRALPLMSAKSAVQRGRESADADSLAYGRFAIAFELPIRIMPSEIEV